jgi:hypothetical protein
LKKDNQKKSPTDLRRSFITIFIGAGLFMLGWIAILKGVGALVGLIGVGQIGYIYLRSNIRIFRI